MDPTAVIGTVLVTLGGIIATLVTRRNAKEATAVTGFASLTAAQREEIDRYGARIDALEDEARARRALARRHEQWDWNVRRQLEQLGQTVPEPPPLDTWENGR